VQGIGLIGLELEQVIAAVLDDEAGGLLLAVQGVGGDDGPLERCFFVEPARGSQFAFAFGLLGFRGLGSLRQRVSTMSRIYLPSRAKARGSVPW
jgi:hypothetical protein